MLKNLKISFSLLILLVLIGCTSCVNSKKATNQSPSKEKVCMDNVIAIDAKLGKIRNHSCEKISLSETISNYVNELNKISFDDCPKAFDQAFKSHINAWLEMIPVTDNYPNLRGELHDLFDKIEAGKDKVLFKKRLDAIWKTWADIEETMKN